MPWSVRVGENQTAGCWGRRAGAGPGRQRALEGAARETRPRGALLPGCQCIPAPSTRETPDTLVPAAQGGRGTLIPPLAKVTVLADFADRGRKEKQAS